MALGFARGSPLSEMQAVCASRIRHFDAVPVVQPSAPGQSRAADIAPPLPNKP